METKEIKAFGESENKNFSVKDSIGVPHPYCITPKHIDVASDEFMGMLGKEAIARAEEKGVVCDICKKANIKNGTAILSYEEHQQALLINCKKDIQKDEEAKKELQEYLLKIKDKATKKGFVGFAFLSNF